MGKDLASAGWDLGDHRLTEVARVAAEVWPWTLSKPGAWRVGPTEAGTRKTVMDTPWSLQQGPSLLTSGSAPTADCRLLNSRTVQEAAHV